MKKNSLLFLIFLPILAFYSYICYFSTNVPYMDDYDNILNFQILWVKETNIWQKILLVFSFHNEHRTVFNHLITLLYYFTFHNLNFWFFAFFGSLFILPSFFIVYVTFRRRLQNFWFFFPAALFLFQPIYFDSAVWAMSSLSNFPVICFSFAAIFTWFANKKVISLCFAVLAAFTQGNGLAVLPAIFLTQFLNNHKLSQKSLMAAVFFFILTSLYFLGYCQPPQHAGNFNSLAAALYFLSFLGNFASFYEGSSPFIPVFFGLGIFAVYLFLAKKKYYNLNPKVFTMLTFIIITAILGAWGRHILGVNQALSYRYKINTAFLYDIFFLASLEIIKSQDWKINLCILFSAIAFFYNVVSYSFYWHYNADRQNNLIKGLQIWPHSKKLLFYPDQNKADDILRENLKWRVFIY